MDELIQVYLESAFTEEMQEEIARSFSLFDAFEYDQAQTPLIDILMNQSNLSSADMQDQFMSRLHEGLNFVLLQHTIRCTPDTTIYQKNELIRGLAHIQRLEDYTPIIRTLETLESDEFQLATVLSMVSALDTGAIMHEIESFNPRLLKHLKNYIYDKEESLPVEERGDKKLVGHVRFFNHVFGDNNLGSQMVRGQLRIGEMFETYLEYIRDVFVGPTDEQTAINLLSVIYLSGDGFNSPLLVYRKYSFQLLQDLDRTSKIEVEILRHIAKLSEYKKAQSEKDQLTQTVVHVNGDHTGAQ